MPPAISTFAVNSNKTYTPLQNFHFNLSSVDPEHQDTAHVHQALLDPTGQYLLFPDLGADLVHVYCASPQTNMLIEHAPLKSKSGYGPRHAVFWSPEHDPESVFLFVIHELSNKIVSYAVDYLPAGGLAFYEVDEVSTFGDREIPTKDAAASEITVVRNRSSSSHVIVRYANTNTDTRQQVRDCCESISSNIQPDEPGS
jgi:6-phosphogluconolactonase (cycloisomerase 2 family)